MYGQGTPVDYDVARYWFSRAIAPAWKSTSVSGALFSKSFLGDDATVLAPSSGEEPASPRHRAGVASMAWRTNAP